MKVVSSFPDISKGVGQIHLSFKQKRAQIISTVDIHVIVFRSSKQRCQIALVYLLCVQVR